MSVLGKLFGRAKRAPQLSSSVVEHDRIDEYVLQDLRASSERFDSAMSAPLQVAQDDGSSSLYEHSEALREDLFYAMHTTRNARPKPSEQVKPSFELNRQLIERTTRSEQFRDVRAHTRADKIQSAITVRSWDNELQRAFGEELAEEADRANQMDHEEQRAEDAQQLIDQLREQAKDMLEAGQEVPGDVAQKMKEAAQERAAARNELAQLDAAQQAAAMATAAKISQVVARAGERANETVEAFAEVAGIDPASHEAADPDQAFALADAWADNPQLRKLSVMVGRFKRDFRAKAAKKIVGGREERTGVELGNDLTRVLPSELLRLGHPVLNVTFLKDYVDRSLVQYETHGEEPANLGPCLILIDLSESTNKDDRHLYEKAVAIATCAHVHRDHRTVGVATYNGALTGAWLFPKNRPIDLGGVTEFATAAPAGGTNGNDAFKWAIEMIRRAGDFDRADIVLATDGQDIGSKAQHVEHSTQIRQDLTEMGVRVFGITVGRGPTDYTNLMCDEQLPVHDLAAPSPATDRLAQAVAA
jgi:uncharacterized protein with von Willebrand factor type A (vWA) domain